MSKIRILFIIPKAQQGGAEQQLIYLLNKMNTFQFKIHLGFLYHNPEILYKFKELEKRGITLIDFKKKHKYDVSVYARIAHFIKKEKIDIVHSFMSARNAYLPAWLSRTPVKTVSGIMHTYRKNIPLLDKISEMMIGKRLSHQGKLHLVSCSYSGSKSYIDAGFAKGRVFTIPNGIDYNYHASGNADKIIKEFGLKGKQVLITVGRLHWMKNHKEIIDIFCELQKNHRNLVLLIVGGGPEKQNLEAYVQSIGLEGKIIITGNRGDINDLLAASDIFIFTSLTEGWPNAIGEAMSAKLPVVTYEVGDVPDIIKNGFNGFNVKRSKSLMIKQVDALLKNPNLRRKIGLEGYKTIREEFSVETMADKYQLFYRKLMKLKPNEAFKGIRQ